MTEQKKKLKKSSKIAISILLVLVIVSSSLAGVIIVTAKNQQRSSTSLLYEGILTVFLPQKVDEKTSYRHIAESQEKNKDYQVPKIYPLLYGFEITKFQDFEVCVFNAEQTNTVLYMHGGAFMYQPLIFHYDYCRRLAKQLNVRIIMPVYPKAPEYSYKDIIPYCADLYLDLLKDTAPENIVFMGDSAGGTIIMSLSQYLYDNEIAQPAQIFAFSPCVDMSLSNSEIAEYDAIDPMLKQNDLLIKLAPYLADADITNPYANPLYCDYSVLPTMTVFVGGHELFLPDCRKLNQMLTEKNIAINYYEYPFMNHTFAIFPIPESEECMDIIKSIWGI